jgi:hypothetical protein
VIWRACLAALALLGTALASACSQTNNQCDCADPAITISIPTDVAASVTAVRASGPACTGVTPTCANQTGGCSQYRLLANAAGVCHIEVDFSGTTAPYTRDVTTVAATSCCDGFYPQPAGDVTVPEPDAGS